MIRGTINDAIKTALKVVSVLALRGHSRCALSRSKRDRRNARQARDRDILYSIPNVLRLLGSASRLNWGLKRLYGADRTSPTAVTRCCCSNADELLQGVRGMADGENEVVGRVHGITLLE